MAEWRFLLFTIIVTVKSLIWNVIRIVSPPFGDVTNRLPFVQRPVFTVLQFSTSCNICFIWPRRAQQCRVRTQSAAVLSSLAPHDSKARLRAVTSSRDSWRSHVHRARLRSACSSSSTRPAMSGVEGDAPCLSLGDSKGVFSSKREYPLWCRGAHAAPPPALAREKGCSAAALRLNPLRPMGAKRSSLFGLQKLPAPFGREKSRACARQ